VVPTPSKGTNTFYGSTSVTPNGSNTNYPLWINFHQVTRSQHLFKVQVPQDSQG